MVGINQVTRFPIAKYWFLIGLIISCIFFPLLFFVTIPPKTALLLFIVGLFLFNLFPIFLIKIKDKEKENTIYFKVLEKQVTIDETYKAGVVYDIIDIDKKRLEKYIDNELKDVK